MTVGDFGITEYALTFFVVAFSLWIFYIQWKSAKQLRKTLLSMPTKKKAKKEWVPFGETKEDEEQETKKYYCQECGKEVSETEYLENEGYCKECRDLHMEEEEEEFPAWEL